MRHYKRLIITAATLLLHQSKLVVSLSLSKYRYRQEDGEHTYHGIRARPNTLKGTGTGSYHDVQLTPTGQKQKGMSRERELRRRRRSKKKTTPVPSGKGKRSGTDECRDDDFIPCANKGYYVCIFDELQDKYSTHCSADTRGSVYSSKEDNIRHTNDYCGQCSISRQFIHASFVEEIAPIQGTEYVTSSSGDIFRTDFDATFNDFGFISLAASEDLVKSVSCASVSESLGLVSIVFESDVEPGLVGRMFPHGSLLIVDGYVFGSCEVAGEANKDFTTNPILDGFIRIESVYFSGPQVTLIGEVGNLFYLFKSFFMTSSLQQRRNLAVGGKIDLKFPFNLPSGDNEPVYLDNELSFTGNAHIAMAKTNFTFFPVRVAVACDINFELNAGYESSLIFKIDEGDERTLFDRTYPSENVQDWTAIPIYKLGTAEAMEKVVNKFLKKSQQINLSAGLSLAFPLNIKLEQATALKFKLGGINATASIGKHRLQFRYDTDVSPLPSVDMVSEKVPSFDLKQTAPFENGLSDAFSTDTKLEGFAGIQPQILFETFGLATGSFGLRTGLFFEAKLGLGHPHDPIDDNPGFPVLFGVCDRCHHLQATLKGGIVGPFLWYKVLDKKKANVDVPEFQLSMPVVHACFFDGNCGIPAVDIDAADQVLFGEGGLPNKEYDFTLRAYSLPETVGNVRFEWSPGWGLPDSIVKANTNGEATASIELSYPHPGVFKLDVMVYDDGLVGNNPPLASLSVDVRIKGAFITIDPPGLADAKVGEQYTFNLIASGVSLSQSRVRFEWSFGVGISGTGSAEARVVDGEATLSISHTYTTEGAFGLVADIRTIGTSEVLAESSAFVLVGEVEERNYDLTICDSWTAANQGGQGVTQDTWDISMIPPNALFDIRYDFFSIPDNIYVQYPNENIALNTGWRGDQSYNGSPLYPGGVVSPGADEVTSVFSRLTQDHFIVIVVGPDSGTAWNYKVRCRIPGQEVASEVFEISANHQNISAVEYENDMEVEGDQGVKAGGREGESIFD